VKYKNLNSQVALGIGNTTNDSTVRNTGETDRKGMFFGEQSFYSQVKCFGIECLWGNAMTNIDGFVMDNNRDIFTAFKDFNNSGTGYTNQGKAIPAEATGYIRSVQGSTETGFIVMSVGGSATAFFSDYTNFNVSGPARFGGSIIVV
jgi:hypothetical protein